ncbi:MAG: hypothetical protein Q9227_008322 [Pyrenula ochraceoflavens]
MAVGTSSMHRDPHPKEVLDHHRQPDSQLKSDSRPSTKGRIQEWVDGNLAHSSAAADAEVSLAESYSHACLLVFEGLWTHVLRDPKLLDSRERNLAQNAVGKFHLWVDSIYGTQTSRGFAKSADIQQNVLDLLSGIAKILVYEIVPKVFPNSKQKEKEHAGQPDQPFRQHVQELTELIDKVRLTMLNDSSSDNDSESSDDAAPAELIKHLRRIASLTKCLMALLPSLQRASYLTSNIEKYQASVSASSFKVSNPAYPFVSQILEKFQSINTRLADRLGQANWERYQRIRQRTEIMSNSDPKDEQGVDLDPAPKSLFQPMSMFHDSGIGSSCAPVSAYAVSNASHRSLLSDLEGKDPSSLRVPETPAQVALGQPFDCHICGRTLSNIKNRIHWK